jgi:hypothetical protein
MEVIAKGIWFGFYMPSKVSAMGTIGSISEAMGKAIADIR